MLQLESVELPFRVDEIEAVEMSVEVEVLKVVKKFS